MPYCHDGLAPDLKPTIADPTPPKVPGLGSFPPVGTRTGREKSDKEKEPPPVFKACRDLATILPRGPHPILTPCPPCAVPVKQECVGGHSFREVPCVLASSQVFACGMPCGRPLPCTQHICMRPCHDAGKEFCGECTLPCVQQRPKHCTHACSLGRCHPLSCAPCIQPVTVPCNCRKTQLHFVCYEFQRAMTAVTESGDTRPLGCGKICNRQLLGCPHLCKDVCHPGLCSRPATCEQEVTVRCSCKRIREKWSCRRVREALISAGGTGEYDSAPRLLECDETCEAEKQAKLLEKQSIAPAAEVSEEGDAGQEEEEEEDGVEEDHEGETVDGPSWMDQAPPEASTHQEARSSKTTQKTKATTAKTPSGPHR